MKVPKPLSVNDQLADLVRTFVPSDPLKDMVRASTAFAETMKSYDFVRKQSEAALNLNFMSVVGAQNKLHGLDSVAEILARERETHEKLMRAFTGGADAPWHRNFFGREIAALVGGNKLPFQVANLPAKDLEQINNPFKWIEEAASKHKSVYSALESALSVQREQIDRLFSVYAGSEIDINEDEIGIGGERVSATQLRSAFDTLCASDTESKSDSESYAKRFASLPEVFQWFILCVLVPYIVSIIANLHTPYYERVLTTRTEPAPGVKAEIRAAGMSVFLSGDARSFRFVNVKQLSVREACRSKSQLIDSLSFGKTVRLLRREKDWSVVEYSDKSKQVLQDCVYSRYLTKFE